MSDPVRVGVVLCSCASTLCEHLDLAALARPNDFGAEVAFLPLAEVLCSRAGQQWLRRELAARACSRLVIGACTPLEHGDALRAAAAAAGINPFLVHIVNLREQCAWVTAERRQATRKAAALLAAGIRRVRCQEPLQVRSLAVNPAVAVVGGGVAGLSAAVLLADAGRQVYLLERDHYLGGRAYRYSELAPRRECGACALGPLLDRVLHHPGIEVVTAARVRRCLGREGDFRLTVEVGFRGVDVSRCLGCGACVAACPVEEATDGGGEAKALAVAFPGALPHTPVVDPHRCRQRRGEPCAACSAVCPVSAVDPVGAVATRDLGVGAVVVATGLGLFDPALDPRFGLPALPQVITAVRLEALLEQVEEGAELEQLLAPAVPGQIVLLHCVGSRSGLFHDHCSGICCSYLGKLAAQLHAHLPQARVQHLYVDLCLPGREAEQAFRAARRESGAALVRRRSADEVSLHATGEGAQVRYRDPGGRWRALSADLVILAPALRGGEAGEELCRVLRLKRDANGFLHDGAELLDANATTRPGMFAAGCARLPGNVQWAAADGRAAAAQVLATLVPGREILTVPTQAVVCAEHCSGCGACGAACDFGAVALDAERVAVVDAALCQGCGSCAAACPAGAVFLKHYTEAQLAAEVGAVVGVPRRAGAGT